MERGDLDIFLVHADHFLLIQYQFVRGPSGGKPRSPIQNFRDTNARHAILVQMHTHIQLLFETRTFAIPVIFAVNLCRQRRGRERSDVGQLGSQNGRGSAKVRIYPSFQLRCLVVRTASHELAREFGEDATAILGGTRTASIGGASRSRIRAMDLHALADQFVIIQSLAFSKTMASTEGGLGARSEFGPVHGHGHEREEGGDGEGEGQALTGEEEERVCNGG
mmetsp:Transcript_20028/g.42126  ORF Transcript_20028/g.42126 Transcript_20028/m.42126 type:complete len:222 (+) Transcript_20028:2944-3609(+)